MGSKVYYFYNSTNVPKRTQNLFDQFGVKQILIDTGPQAISGSTRLQAATIAELCLGATLTDVINQSMDVPQLYNYAAGLESINQRIASQTGEIAEVTSLGITALADKNANFRKLTDLSDAAYITILGDRNSIRETLVDATETSPTFSTNPPRSIHETHKKKSEFRAYLLGVKENIEAWKTLSGLEDFSAADKAEISEILVAQEAAGFGSFSERPKGKGNLVLVALKSPPTREDLAILAPLKKQGGKIALIYLSDTSEKLAAKDLEFWDAVVHLPLSQGDPLGVLQTVALKQVLNMISNGMMLGMHKIIGNRMVDLRLSNKKLEYRSVRILKDLLKRTNVDLTQYNDERLYDMLMRADAYKNNKEITEGIYVPTPVKVVITQLIQNTSLEDAVQFLYQSGENVESLLG